MGDPIKRKKQYARPRKPWDRSRLETERKTKKTYGLKNKRELWKTQALVRKKRQSARKLLAFSAEQREKTGKKLLKSLTRYGFLGSGAAADDVLGMGASEVLEKRLQTMVVRKGLANTMKQARQFIVHGHIAVNNHKVTAPSYLVQNTDTISYYGKPMVLNVPAKKQLKKEFGEALPETEKTKEETLEEAEEEAEVPEEEGAKAEVAEKETPEEAEEEDVEVPEEEDETAEEKEE